jgi:hypothetical protein
MISISNVLMDKRPNVESRISEQLLKVSKEILNYEQQPNTTIEINTLPKN